MTRTDTPIRPLQILLIEDDDDHAELTLHALEAHDGGHRAVRVADGAEALDYLLGRGAHAGAERPDLVLLDLNLPKVGGLDVLDQIKSDPDLRLIPVVVLTTSDAEEDRREAYERYANSYLVKPVSYDKFEAMIQRLSDYWGRWNRTP